MSNNSREWLGDLPLYAKQNRELFARFGLALYHAQCLEIQVGQLLAVHNPEFFAMSPEQRDRAFDVEHEKTLGRLIDSLVGRMQMSPSLRDRLREANRLRNWLAHRYFWERAKHILKPEGRENMIVELQEKADLFRELDRELTDFATKLIFRAGVSNQEFESLLEPYDPGDDTI